jgi:glycogen synthase
LRIAFLSFEFPPETAHGGIATYTVQAANMLAGRGHEVEVFVGGSKDTTYVTLTGIRVNMVRCVDNCRFAFPAGVAFARRHLEAPFSVLEAPEYLAEAEFAIRFVPDVPLVIRMHSPSGLLNLINTPPTLRNLGLSQALPQYRMFAGALRRREPLPSLHLANSAIVRGREMESKELCVAREADEIVSPSYALKNYAINTWKLSPEKVVHLPNPFVPSEALLGIHPLSESPTVGFFGRLEVRKGIFNLCRAIPEIAKAVPSARFLFVGRNADNEGTGSDAARQLEYVCKSAGVNAEFTGQQPGERLPEWFANTRVAVFPSVWENFPYVCLEAMSAARAVVASTAGGMADMIEDDQTGLLSPPENSRQLASNIIKLLRDPELCCDMGVLARASVLKRYSAEALGSRFEECYERAIESRLVQGPRLQPWLVS